MRFETIDALDYLVGTYVSAIEGVGTKIPEETVELIGTDPFKACEALNDLALSCNAITPDLDMALQTIYESMDAEDSRSEATPEACQRCLATFARVHIEIPDPEPEPEPEESPEAEEAAQDSETVDGATEQKSRKRRQRRKRNNEGEATNTETDDSTDAKTEAHTTEETAEAKAGEESAESKPKKRTRNAAKKLTDKAPKAEPANTPFEGDALTVDQALAILGCSRPKLTKMIETGELPAYKKGRSWQVSAAAVSAKAAEL